LQADAAPSLVFVPHLPGAGDEFALPPEEVHYLRRVCRARPGDRVRASDGAGTLASLELLSLADHGAGRVIERSFQAGDRQAWVLCGAPEGHRADWLVEKLAELGVRVFQPLELERARFDEASSRRERWERLTVAALRQSRSAWRLEIRPPVGLAEALAAVPDGANRWIGDREGERGLTPPGRSISVGVIGPSQGLAVHERERLADGGFRAIALADNRLRAETAALAWAAWWASGTS
jgi:16S rRNA (uracil1498-N3)-methyltransferase